jgi:uncharacterized protein YbjT (DUF2867 family)
MDKSSRTILVTGATGHQGGSVLKHLMTHGWDLRAMTRDASSPAAQKLANMGVEVVQADYNDRDSLDRAVKGAYGVYCVTTPQHEEFETETAHGMAMADAAQAAGVEHFVFSSVASANEMTGIPHFESKYKVELHIRELGMRYTIVRPVYLMENLARGTTKEGILNGTLAMGIHQHTPLQMIALDDIGYAVTRVFDRPEKYVGKSVDIAGDELTGPDAAKALGKAMGCEVNFQELSVNAIAGLVQPTRLPRGPAHDEGFQPGNTQLLRLGPRVWLVERGMQRTALRGFRPLRSRGTH